MWRPEGGVFHHHMGDNVEDEHEDDGVGDAEIGPHSEPFETVRKFIEDGIAIRDHEGEAAGDEHHGQGDNERGNGESGDHDAVEEADTGTHTNRRQGGGEEPDAGGLDPADDVLDQPGGDHAERATRLPTERSIPAVMMTMVMPMAMMAMTAIWLATLMRLSFLRKVGHR